VLFGTQKPASPSLVVMARNIACGFAAISTSWTMSLNIAIHLPV
jgi:hypothetical protein